MDDSHAYLRGAASRRVDAKTESKIILCAFATSA